MDANFEIEQILSSLSHLSQSRICWIDLEPMYTSNYAAPDISKIEKTCPQCAFLTPSRCHPHWDASLQKDDIRQCPEGYSFIVTPLKEGPLTCGSVVIGPLGANDIENFERLQSLEILSEAAASLIEKLGLLPKRSDIFATIARYITTHLTDDLNADSLKSALYISSSTISRVVKRESGLPLRLFIQSQRLEAARIMLANPNMPIIQIAEKCGISDFNYFSRVFKQYFGMTPTAMRNSILNHTSPML